MPITQWRSVKQAFTGIFFGLPTTNILLTLSGMYTANHIIPDADFHHRVPGWRSLDRQT